MAEASAAADPIEAAPETAAISGSRKKLILIVAAAVLLLGGGGGAAYYFMSGANADDEDQSTEQVDAGTDKADKAGKKGKKAKKGKEATEKKHKKPAAPAIYYKVDPALVVNFEAAGVTRFLQVAIEISTRDPETSEALKLHDPVIRNDLLLLMGGQDEATITSREGKEKLRAQALDAVRKVIDNEGGEGSKVENVYFTSFVMQ